MSDGEQLAPVPSASAAPDAGSDPTKPATPPATARVERTRPGGEAAAKTSWQSSEKVRDYIKSLAGENSTVSIRMDPNTHRITVEVINSETGEVIRRVPPGDLLELAAQNGEINGLSLDTMA